MISKQSTGQALLDSMLSNSGLAFHSHFLSFDAFTLKFVVRCAYITLWSRLLFQCLACTAATKKWKSRQQSKDGAYRCLDQEVQREDADAGGHKAAPKDGCGVERRALFYGEQ